MNDILKSFKFDLQMFATPVQPTPENTFNYTEADRDNETNFGKLLEPGLRKIFFETYDEIPEQFSQIYNVESSTKAVEHDWGMGAFGTWEKRASQIDTVAYGVLSPGLDRRYVHDAFTKGFMITREMYDDDMYRQMDKMSMALARAGRAKVESDAMIPLVKGFDKATRPIYDGEAFFSNAHPLLEMDYVATPGAKKGNNLITGPLSDVNLKEGIQLMREVPDEIGNLVQYKADRLIIPPALEDTAIRLLQSAQLAGGQLNDTNKFLNSYGIQTVVLDYLGAAAGGSDTHWFLQDSKRHELNFFWRVKPEFEWDKDFDTYVSKYKGYMRYSYGVSDWRGMAGSTGL